jgi:hypothetical protein
VDIFRPADLKQLLEIAGELCISLYMPTHRMGQDQPQDRIRLKNLLAEAEQRLVAAGLRRTESVDFLHPAENLMTDRGFWQHQSDGLAVFLSPRFSLTYRLPSPFGELLVVGNTFHIKPLLPLLSEDGRFYLLLLSRNAVRLFLGTRETISQVQLKGVPADIQSALWMDEPDTDKQTNFHTGSRNPGGAGGERPGVFHGQNPQDEEKTNILRYFHRIDEGLVAMLEDYTIPMVLAGVEFILPIYHQANTYKGLLEEGVAGNPEVADLRDLHKRAWAIVQPIFKREHDEAVSRFEQYYGAQNGLAISDLKAGVEAAEVGRVDTLFVPLGVEQWGRYDAANNQVELHPEPGPENEELFDLAARRTLLNSGQVYAVPPDQLPGKGELAAILRYAL